jgi:hypothetical protein
VRTRASLNALVLFLIASILTLTSLANARPPDPTWLPGYFDDDDFDDVVGYVTSATGVAAGPVVWCARPVSVLVVLRCERSEDPIPLDPFSPSDPRGPPAVHKDIKPTNVLVNSATGDVWLRSFGIASRLLREPQPPEPPEFIAGTLPYMAPEQTGRMNRSIDSRSDLYALGVTLYEMLTGSLPFSVTDPMELVHCHIARQPVPPSERLKGVPGTVSAIVMKLLAKTAEERYQTAACQVGTLLAPRETGRAGCPALSGKQPRTERLCARQDCRPEAPHFRGGDVAR